MPDPSALYPQPPQQSQGALMGDPMRLIGAMRELQELGLRRQQIPALAQQPAATLQGTQIQNTTAQFEQEAAQTKMMHDLWGSQADKKGLGPEDVYNFQATAARAGIPATKIIEFGNRLHKYPGGYGQAAKDSRAFAIGSGGTVAPETGPPEPGTGATTVVRRGAANQGPVAGFPTAQAPGESESQVSSAGRGANLIATAGTSPQYHADLENLRQDSKILENLGGPTAEVEKKLNQLAHRVGNFGITMNADQLRAAESFDKIANQVSLNQSKMFHGSDAGLHTVLGANPSLSMSRYGREGVIDMLQGNQDAIDTTRKAWADARAKGAPMHSHDTFINKFSEVIDPRVFQFNRLSRENQQKFLSQLDPSDLPEFEQKYQTAIDSKWVKPLKPNTK